MLAAPNMLAAAYPEIRRSVVAAGLLERAYGYYAWRALVSFGLLGLGPVSLWLLPGPAWLGLHGLLLAFGSIQVALIGHDAGHLAVFKTARANLRFGQLCWSLVLGISFAYWCDRHNRHHASTNDVDADPDLQWANLVAYSEDILATHAPRSPWLIRYQAILGPLYTLGLAFGFRAEGWSFALRRMRGRARVLEIALLGTSIALWLMPVVIIGWGWLVTFAVGQVLAGLYLALVIAPNHKGMPTWTAGQPLEFIERQVLSSRNVLAHPITDFVFGGLNYQIEHHLFPTMPRVHFGKARLLVKPFCLRHGLPYEEMGAFASYRLVVAELRRVSRSAAARTA